MVKATPYITPLVAVDRGRVILTHPSCALFFNESKIFIHCWPVGRAPFFCSTRLVFRLTIISVLFPQTSFTHFLARKLWCYVTCRLLTILTQSQSRGLSDSHARHAGLKKKLSGEGKRARAPLRW